MSGSFVWWNMSGSSVESETLSPIVKNSWKGFFVRRRKSALFDNGESANPICVT